MHTPAAYIKCHTPDIVKIYAVIQIEIGQGHKAIKIAYKAMVFGGTVKSFFPILILGMLPNKLSRILFLKLR